MSSNSVSWDRTFLLSSRFSMRSPRSCAPASAAPSLCECPRFPGSPDSCRYGSRLAAAGGCTNKDFFHSSIAVAIQSSSRDRFSASHDAAGLHLIFRTHMRHHRQPAVAPQLMPGAKPMRSIDGRHDQRRSDRSQLRNRSAAAHRSMLSAFGQHCSAWLVVAVAADDPVVHIATPTRCCAPGSVS